MTVSIGMEPTMGLNKRECIAFAEGLNNKGRAKSNLVQCFPSVLALRV